MDIKYGKLTLLNPNGPEQEFELAKQSISLGRATTKDITLDDVRVSRNHARLDCGAKGVTLVDLGSSNGTWVNGIRMERATLIPGDTISLGSQQLRYSVDDPSDDMGLTVIDTQMQLDQTINDEYLPVVINEVSGPSLVMFTGDRTWSIDLESMDLAIIGRDESCAVLIDADKVSRRHAEVQQRGKAFLLKDLGSTNGTWVHGRQIDQHILQDGDVFRIGSAQIIFKRGFQEQDLTMVEEQMAVPAGRRTVVFVPGLMGSELWLGNERVWPSVKTLFTNPEIFIYPSKIPLEPRSIVDEVVIVPNLIKQDQYNRLGDYMVDELNFRRDVDFFEFPYDWRQDVRITAGQLGQLIDSISSKQPLIIIGHSLGTLVTRYYVECLGGDKRVERVILMGGPHKGAVKGLSSMLVAPEVLPFGIMGDRMRKIVMTFPSSYQILPDYAVGTDQHGVKINFLEESSWLDPEYLPLLKIGRSFRRELKPTAGIPTVSIFGYGIKTISSFSIRRDAAGKVESADYLSENTGDGSVLEQSAFLQGSEIHPVHQHHGALFVDNDVKMRLKIELMRPY
ncbi:MAG: FHA domain-containing protein [Ardenticatenales bacterium]|nr:FHA domain-containing protein [Ardenticatenales bacterium]